MAEWQCQNASCPGKQMGLDWLPGDTSICPYCNASRSGGSKAPALTLDGLGFGRSRHEPEPDDPFSQLGGGRDGRHRHEAESDFGLSGHSSRHRNEGTSDFGGGRHRNDGTSDFGLSGVESRGMDRSRSNKAKTWRDYKWSQLERDEQRDWRQFDWNEETWNNAMYTNNGDAPEPNLKSWNEMHHVEQEAADRLGFDRNSWEEHSQRYRSRGRREGLLGNGGSSFGKSVPDWENMSWDRLSSSQKNDWKVLGWSRERWDGKRPPDSDNYAWNDLRREQKEAAERLGYSSKTWQDRRRGGKSVHNFSKIASDYSRDMSDLPKLRRFKVTVKRISTTVKSYTGSLEVGIGDKIMQFEITNHMNVYDLKMLIYCHREGIGWAPKNQKLIFDKDELRDEDLFEDLGMQEGAVVSLLRQGEYFHESENGAAVCSNCSVS